mmetsp:Transcript_3421/g.11563  ORF Transcript_3421/g.11563 Transcript_3421/m.11563 type:complete len:332 (-) Transcript_3421:1359-2354(-)|eukprot:30237-Pelagococcus_subviridis.AAC.9
MPRRARVHAVTFVSFSESTGSIPGSSPGIPTRPSAIASPSPSFSFFASSPASFAPTPTPPPPSAASLDFFFDAGGVGLDAGGIFSVTLISSPVNVSRCNKSAESVCKSCECRVSSFVTRACESRSNCTTSLSTSASVALRPPLLIESTCTGPTSDESPTSPTMYVASRVACCKSESAPVVTSSLPKMSSSATLPPMHTSSLARSCRRVIDVSSLSGSCVTIPSALPRGTIVALCTGIAPGVRNATIAWPASWYAVSLLLSSVSTADLRSTPMTMRSLAHSSRAASMTVSPATAACTAAMLTRLKSSAPLNPAVPRASVSTSTSNATGLSAR